ncbi:MAG TPA: VOC family protein [Falsiroseomonas sp.]|jgi:catechol 2,3-dioxygenase-like lactoylglutathione lyase family enzyme|nr:VOC family protein [Falsiroseomonas sp.]
MAMALRHVIGLDHVVVSVRDLDAAAAALRKLGFTVSPRGTHSAHMGSGNYTMMFGEDYIELLGVLSPTPHNAPMRAFLETREGLERAAFTTDDAAAGAEELRARGIAAIGPVHFGRPVTLPDGGHAEARFNVFQWPQEEKPGGLRIFACQHLTRENVWIPALQLHPNGATRILRLEVLTADPAVAATHMAGLLDRVAEPESDGALRVPTGRGRADIVFLDRAMLAARHPGVTLEGLPAEGAAALVLGTRDAQGAARSLGVAPGAMLAVPASAASGIMLRFLPV